MPDTAPTSVVTERIVLQVEAPMGNLASAESGPNYMLKQLDLMQAKIASVAKAWEAAMAQMSRGPAAGAWRPPVAGDLGSYGQGKRMESELKGGKVTGGDRIPLEIGASSIHAFIPTAEKIRVEIPASQVVVTVTGQVQGTAAGGGGSGGGDKGEGRDVGKGKVYDRKGRFLREEIIPGKGTYRYYADTDRAGGANAPIEVRTFQKEPLPGGSSFEERVSKINRTYADKSEASMMVSPAALARIRRFEAVSAEWGKEEKKRIDALHKAQQETLDRAKAGIENDIKGRIANEQADQEMQDKAHARAEADKKAKEKLRKNQEKTLRNAASEAKLTSELTYQQELMAAQSRANTGISGLPKDLRPQQRSAEVYKLRAQAAMESMQAAQAASTEAMSRAGSLTGGDRRGALREAGRYQQSAMGWQSQYVRYTEAADRATRAFNESTRHIGKNMIENVQHVTAWASSVFVLYGSLRLATHSMAQMMEIEYRQAILTQILRAGYEDSATSARKLTDEVLRLASANGRSTKEAMESAVQWARLGLTRTETAEAVRVSLVAANVAEITAAEATDHLSSLMMVYKLRAYELSNVLGMLNATSNVYNVSNKNLLNGLTRTAAVAQQAGVPLAELIGLLGAGVGATGQTGANLGNAIKSITGAFSNADVQKMLRKDFKIEVTSHGGEDIKSMPEILSAIWVAYQKMNEAERRSMIFGVAGKNQASRMAALLDNYVRSQLLAINAQLNLNSAEQENALVTATLRANVQSLATEWDRFVNNISHANIGGKDFGPAAALGQVTQAFTNVLRLANSNSYTSGAALGLITLFTALTARMIVTGMAMESVDKKGGVLRATFAQLGKSVGDLRTIMAEAFARYPVWVQNLAGVSTAASTGARAVGLLRGAVVLSLAAFAEFLPYLAIVTALIWGFNQAMEFVGVTSKKSEDLISGFEQKAIAAGQAVEAAATAMRLIKTVQEGMDNTTDPAKRKALAGSLAEAGFPGLVGKEGDERRKQLQTELELVSGVGKETEFRIKAERILADWIKFRSEKRREELDWIRKSNDENERAIKKIQESSVLTAAQKEAKSNPFRQRLEANAGKRVQLIQEGIEDQQASVESFKATSIEHQSFLERQKVILQGIKELYDSMPGDSHLEKLYKEIGAQTTIRNILQKQKDEIDAKIKSQDKGDDEVKAGFQKRWDDLAKSRQGIADLFNKETGRADRGTSLTPFEIEQRTSAPLPFSWNGAKVTPTKGSPLYHAQRALEGTRETQAQIEADENAYRAKPGLNTRELKKQSDAIGEDIKKANTILGAKSAHDSEAARLAEAQDRQAIALRLGKMEIGTYGVGEGRGEQLVNTISGLRKGIDDKEGRLREGVLNEQAAEMARVQAMQERVTLTENLVKGEEMLRELHKEELNLMIQKNREYQRSLMTAGPAELLRRMALNQLAPRGGKPMSAGGFFALDTGMRQDWMNRPENSEEIRGNRRQQDVLRNAGFGAKSPAEIAQMVIDAGKSNRGVLTNNPVDFAGLAEINVAARTAAGNLVSLATSAKLLEGQFIATISRLNTLLPGGNGNKNSAPPVAQAG